MKNNIFLDCGSNLGQGYESIRKIFNLEDFQVFMFEPNKICYEHLKKVYKDNKIFRQAVWNKSEKRLLNVEYCPEQKQLCGGATNILEENFIKPNYIDNTFMKDRPSLIDDEKVDCVNFSEFLQNNFSPLDNIIVKLDIEGAEIEVLDKLIEDGTLLYIKTIIIEWHFHMRKNNHSSKDYYLQKFNKHNIKYMEWH